MSDLQVQHIEQVETQKMLKKSTQNRQKVLKGGKNVSDKEKKNIE